MQDGGSGGKGDGVTFTILLMMTGSSNQLISFTIDKHLLSIPITVVERVVRAVEVTPLGKAPEIILGVIDYHGDIIPVMSLRKRLGFPDRKLISSDRLMIIRISSRRLALVVDEVGEVIPHDNNRITTSGIFTKAIEAEGITRCSDGLILIYDPEKFLSSSEEFDLEEALKSNKIKKVQINE